MDMDHLESYMCRFLVLDLLPMWDKKGSEEIKLVPHDFLLLLLPQLSSENISFALIFAREMQVGCLITSNNHCLLLDLDPN